MRHIMIMKENSILRLLLLFFLGCSLLLSCYGSETLVNTRAHHPPLNSVLHFENESLEVEKAHHETVRGGGKGGGGRARGVSGGGSIIRKPKRPRSGGCTLMLSSPPSAFLRPSTAAIILLFVLL